MMSRPADKARNAKRTFPIGVLLAAERRHGTVRPCVHVRAVVRGIDDESIVGDVEVVERLENLADVPVVLDHAVGVFR